MQRTEKEQVVTELAEQLRSTESLIVADYRGLTNAQLEELRAKLRGSGARLQVVKNTLTRRAAEAAGSRVAARAARGPDRDRVRRDRRRPGRRREGARPTPRGTRRCSRSAAACSPGARSTPTDDRGARQAAGPGGRQGQLVGVIVAPLTAARRPPGGAAARPRRADRRPDRAARASRRRRVARPRHAAAEAAPRAGGRGGRRAVAEARSRGGGAAGGGGARGHGRGARGVDGGVGTDGGIRYGHGKEE